LALKQLALKLLCGGLQTSEHRFGDGLWKVSGQLGLHRKRRLAGFPMNGIYWESC
jgi:hypothetical protein